MEFVNDSLKKAIAAYFQFASHHRSEIAIAYVIIAFFVFLFILMRKDDYDLTSSGKLFWAVITGITWGRYILLVLATKISLISFLLIMLLMGALYGNLSPEHAPFEAFFNNLDLGFGHISEAQITVVLLATMTVVAIVGYFLRKRSLKKQAEVEAQKFALSRTYWPYAAKNSALNAEES